MGCWLAKAVSPIDKLDRVIQHIEALDARYKTTALRRRFMEDRLIIYGAGVYFVVGAWIYLMYFPDDRDQQNLYLCGYAVYPILMFVLRYLIIWFYKKRMDAIQQRLEMMKEEKSRIVEKLLAEEPYKTFLSCLEKLEKEKGVDRSASALGIELKKQLHQRRVSPVPAKDFAPIPLTPRRSVLDRVCDFIIGDGTDNRYALICVHCRSHNGMALKEEFEYIGFKCCFCNFYNPSRKSRPAGPRLESLKPQLCSGDMDSSSETESVTQ